MIPLVGLIRPLLTAVAPKFVKNLSDTDRADDFARIVKTFVDQNVTPIDENADAATARAEVNTAIDKIQNDPQLSERMMEMLIDAEREMAEKRLADVRNAREFRLNSVENSQSQWLLTFSFVLIFLIVLLLVGMIFIVPRLNFESDDNRELAIQISGAAIGFLTGIGGMFARNIGSVFDFWFGSSVGSKAKTEQIGKYLTENPAPPQPSPPPVPPPAPPAPPTPPTPPPGQPGDADPTVEVDIDIAARLAEFRKQMAEAD